jgi:uncharacterized protein (UPF0248 family)
LHPLRAILNRILWNEKEGHYDDYVVTYIHRGAPGDSRGVSFARIKKIGKSWFSLVDFEEEVIIPFHRILTVKNIQTGEVLWRKRQ